MSRYQRTYGGTFATTTSTVDTTGAPCTLMPEFWDAPNLTGRGTVPEAEQDRLAYAVAACRRCPALAACLRYVAGWSYPDGSERVLSRKRAAPFFVSLRVPARRGVSNERDAPNRSASQRILGRLFGYDGKERGRRCANTFDPAPDPHGRWAS